MFEERVCAPEEHIAFTPLKVEIPVSGADEVLLSFSGLDHAEAYTIRRLLRALGISLAPNFSRRSTHLLCPSREGAKAEKAREWGTPIVDMSWLAAIADTGEIPSAHPPANDEGVLNLPVAQEDWMADEPPAPTPVPQADPKGKGKEQATDGKMADITNSAVESAPGSQSLSYYDPPPDEPRPGQAEQMEVFGMPSMLLGQPDSAPYRPTPPRDPAESAPQSTQPSEPQDEDAVSIPSKLYEERVPSSESPSPLRMPGPEPGPATPAKLVKQATTVIQDRITSLLGKRRSEEEQGDGEESAPARLQGHDSRRDGKRSRPLQRTRSNMSYSELISPPPQPKAHTPKSGKGKGKAVVADPPFALALVTGAQPESLNDGDVDVDAENSFVVSGRGVGGDVRVTYADPRQNGELERLKFLFQSGAGAEGKGQQARKEPWEVEMSMEMDEEVTLPQLPDVLAASGSGRKGSGRGRGRGRRGRGRRSRT